MLIELKQISIKELTTGYQDNNEKPNSKKSLKKNFHDSILSNTLTFLKSSVSRLLIDNFHFMQHKLQALHLMNTVQLHCMNTVQKAASFLKTKNGDTTTTFAAVAG